MLKSIFIQLWNRKRSNIWLFFELLLVFCLIWFMTDYFFVLNYNLNIPNYRDTSHVWQIKINEYPAGSLEFKEEVNSSEIREANYARILQAIRNYPGVESLGISFHGSAPGSGSYWGMSFANPNDSTKEAQGQRITIDTREDFFEVFRYSTDKGKRPVSTKDFEWTNPKGIVVGRTFAEMLFPGESAVGKEIRPGYPRDNPDRFVILGIVDDVKRFNYERPQNTFYFSQQVDAGNISSAQISIRLSSSVSGKLFREKFLNEMTPALQIGNFYLEEVSSYKQIEADTATRFGQTKDIRLRISLMIFFLLSIVLCVIGTFWYRVNVRREEIGLRKALGSTKVGIRNILILEGLCLLAVVLIPAMIIEYQFVRAGLIETMGSWNSIGTYLPDKTILRFLITNGITFLIMAAVIILSIWLPAVKAANLEAADALRDE